MRIARAGKGQLVVMLHGFPECWYSWRHQMRALAPYFTCVAPDMRGYGETDAPRGADNYTIEKLVGDVAGLIQVLGHERAIVVGHDWGGMVAWATALARPDLIERLIVMNCPHPEKMRQNLRSNPRQMLRSWYVFFFQLPWLPEALFRIGDYALVRRSLKKGAVQKDAFSSADLEHFRAAFDRPYSISAAINYYRAIMSRGIISSLKHSEWAGRKIEAPTLLIWGEQDFALGKELTYDMEPLFSGKFELKYIPDSGHWVQQEKPELVNLYMWNFIADLAGKPRSAVR